MKPVAEKPVVMLIRQWLFPLVAGALLLITLGGIEMQKQSAVAVERSQAGRIAELEHVIAQFDEANAQVADVAQALDAGAPSGEVDSALARMASDRKLIEALITTMFTWDDHATYEAARAAMTQQFGQDEGSSLLTELMPPGPVSVDADGVEYPYIDAAGLNSAMGAMTIVPTSVLGAQYSYLVTVAVTSSSTDGSATASVTNLVEVTTDDTGHLLDVSGWATDLPIKESRASRDAGL